MASATKNIEEVTQLDSLPSAEKSESAVIHKSICHVCPNDQQSRKKDQKGLIAASVVCLLFMIAEIVGGILSNSLAIASDAAHLLNDFGTFMVNLAAIWIASKPQTRKMSFGFHRAEVIGALISVLSIWLITGILIYMAVERLLNPSYKVNALIMIYVSSAGIVGNLTMGIALKCYTGISLSSREKDNINMRSATVHVIGDLLQSFSVFIASLVMYIYPALKVIDPICSFIFSVIVLITTFFIMKDIFCVLMEGFPKHLNFMDVKNVLYSIPEVLKVHNIRMWSLTMDKVAMSAHIVVCKGENQSEVLKNAVKVIRENFIVYELTLQVEEAGVSICSCPVCI